MQKAKKEKKKEKSSETEAALEGETTDKPAPMSLDEGSRSVYVSGLPFDFKRKVLNDFFLTFGRLCVVLFVAS